MGTLDICVYGSFFSTPDPSSYGRWLEIVAHPTSDHAHAHSGLQVINFRKVSIVHKELFKEFEMRLYMSGSSLRYILLCRLICKKGSLLTCITYLSAHIFEPIGIIYDLHIGI